MYLNVFLGWKNAKTAYVLVELLFLV